MILCGVGLTWAGKRTPSVKRLSLLTPAYAKATNAVGFQLAPPSACPKAENRKMRNDTKPKTM